MSIGYRLEDINTQDPDSVCEFVTTLYNQAFPDQKDPMITKCFSFVVGMFGGKDSHYQAIDAHYHDLEHTLQACICLVRLLLIRNLLKVKPEVKAPDFITALTAILLHDMGYLKKVGDDEGTGAKYMHIHEDRSAEQARAFLQNQNWPTERIRVVEQLIQCTDPECIIEAIPFASSMDQLLGQAACTADFISQMSDPHYVEKLPKLYKEFEESYDYQNLSPSQRPYNSYRELLEKTPAFWHNFVKKRMLHDCNNLWEYLKDPETGSNPYIEQIEKNILEIESML